MMTEPGSELPDARRATRRAVSVPCEILTRGAKQPLQGHATNLSPLGVWVETPQGFRVGEEVVLTFKPPCCADGTELTVFGEVARIEMERPQDTRPSAGMGVEFIGLSPSEHQKLESCLRGLPPPLPRRPDPSH